MISVVSVTIDALGHVTVIFDAVADALDWSTAMLGDTETGDTADPLNVVGNVGTTDMTGTAAAGDHWYWDVAPPAPVDASQVGVMV